MKGRMNVRAWRSIAPPPYAGGGPLMKRLVPIVAATGAFSQTNVPNEITGYRNINVTYSEKATACCYLEHSAAYSERLRE